LKELIHKILKQNWGYDEFRPGQEEIILSVLENKDTLALLPTGGGKSITFQVPALVRKGFCLVITPLIALMKDQVENLKSRGIRAEAIYSGMSYREIENVIAAATHNKLKLLYCSPERLQTDIFTINAPHMPVNLVAVDESHCISEWGYDFRPSYLKIAEIREYFPKVPILALTATATTEVENDITDKLNFKNFKVFRQSFDRKNIIYAVVKDEAKKKKLIDILKKTKGSGIIYVNTRKSTKELSDLLNHNGISAGFYHGGLGNEERNLRQAEWKNGKIRMMVATNAFGMGIDKADVRVVLHYNLPESLEAYYQEAGRVGRDGKKAYAIAITNKKDEDDLKLKFQSNFPDKKEIQLIYQSLANYFQIPTGTGKHLEFNFDFNDFCKKYNLNPVKTYNGIKILERENQVNYTEDLFLPSRLQILTTHQDIYEFQLDNPKYELLIKTLLRSYDGIYDLHTRIDENEISRRTGLPKDEIIKQLYYLVKISLIDYLPQQNMPRIFFTQQRIEATHLEINNALLNKRKKAFEDRISKVIEYAFHITDCKSRFLLSYFGEKANKRCGHCDYCLKMHETHVSDEEFNIIWENVINLLAGKSLEIEAVVEMIKNMKREKIISTLRWLIDDKRLILETGNLLSLGE
jgi:ATP-dependent DNA helicase RecQ